MLRQVNILKRGLHWLASRLARLGVIDEYRGKRTVDLAWPRMVTGFFRMSQQVFDLAMIGIVLGPAALAGMAFAFAYWQIGNQLSLGLSNGAMGFISQRYGADDDEGIDSVIKQAIWVSIALSVPVTIVYWFVPAELIGLLTSDPSAVEYGAIYLSVVSLALPFEYLNKVSSRTLVGVDDSLTPMYIRAFGAVANVALNAVLIFGFNLGVFGAALGSALATVLMTGLFAWGFVGQWLPIAGVFPIHVRTTPPYVDIALMRRLVVVSTPLMIRWIAHSIVLFPFLAIVGVFGTTTVAAFEVARRVRRLMNAPAWGFSLASTSLVGQYLGMGDTKEAAAYGRDILRFSIFVYVVVAGCVFLFASWIAPVFVDEPSVQRQTTTFIRVAAIAVLWLGLDGAATGALRGAGDTRWPLYGKFSGLYFVALPIAYLGIATPVGIIAIYIAFIAETFVPAAITTFRLWSGRWLENYQSEGI